MKLDLQSRIKGVTVKDIVAIITVTGGLYLISTGKNGVVGMALAMIISFYFGRWRNEKK